VAVPPKPGGSSALKIVLIIVAILVGLGLLGAGVVGYGIYRISKAVHGNSSTGEVTLNTPGGTISTNPTQTFTADELGTDVYPGAQPGKGSMRMNLGGSSVVAANYVTSDSKDKVIAFYKDKLGSEAQTMETAEGAIFTVSKNKDDSIMLNITQKPNQADGKTQIHITHTVHHAS